MVGRRTLHSRLASQKAPPYIIGSVLWVQFSAANEQMINDTYVSMSHFSVYAARIETNASSDANPGRGAVGRTGNRICLR